MELLKSKLSFIGVDILETTFQVSQPFAFEDNVNLDVQVAFKDNIDKSFQLLMSITLKVDGYFRLFVSGLGNFSVEVADETATPEMIQKYIDVNAPAIMFPYMRSFISTFTANCGQSIPTLVIPPQFFQGTLKKI